MKKLLSTVITLIMLLSLSACSQQDNDLQAEVDALKAQLAELKGEENATSDVAESKLKDENGQADEIKTTNKVEFTFDSEYDEGTVGYESDRIEAKKKAIEEQAPEEYADFVFLVNSLYSLSTPSAHRLGDDDYTLDEQKSTLAKIKSAVAEAYSLKERLVEVDRTINNVEEYEMLSTRISSVISMESYLTDYADLLTAEPNADSES